MTHISVSRNTPPDIMIVLRILINAILTVHRPALVRRLARLEKKLKVPPEECHHCEGRIEESVEVFLEGVRVWNRAYSLSLDARSSTTPMHVESDDAAGSSFKGKQTMHYAMVCTASDRLHE